MTLKAMSQQIGDLFLVCRQHLYLANEAGDPEAAKAWNATGNHLAEALLAADRTGPCATCERRTDIRCRTCDTLLCRQWCADAFHHSERQQRGLGYEGDDVVPCHLPLRERVTGAPCLDQSEDIEF